MDNPSPPRTHPIVIVAAVAVTVASLAATAWFAGYLPPRAEPAATAAPAPQATAAAPAPAPTPTSEKKPAPVAKAHAQSDRDAPMPPPRQTERRSASRDPAFAQPGFVAEAPMGDNTWGGGSAARVPQALQTPPVCRECGVVESVREVRQEGEGSGLGAVGGGVIGGLLGNQIGGGRGKTVGAVVGAVGGALAGNEVEKNVRATRHFEIAVRFDDGNVRVFTQTQAPGLQRGERVRMVNGQLMPSP